MKTIHCRSSIERDEIRTRLNARLAFSDVTTRVFPLKASMNRLQDFCDNYLNFVDDDKGNRSPHYFKPALPWVYFQVLNYGEMNTATKSLGWIAQHEVLFLVPLAWYVVENGELRFKDWATVCPFVFVDNDISITTGREIYGWIKVKATLDRLDPNWADDPRKPRQLLDLRTELFPRAYAGEPLEQHTLLQITQAPPPSVFRDPFSKDALFGPGWTMAEAVRAAVSYGRDLLEAVVAPPLMGYDPRSVPTTVEMLARNVFNFTRFLPWWQPDRDTVRESSERAHGHGRNYYLNQINLKQFRDSSEPTYACYQAIVNSQLAIDHYYSGGALGPANLAFGDITGGFRILLHDYPEQQIQSVLGLEVEEWQQAPDNHRLAVLLPQFPFWASYDLRYDNGDTLCWRTKTSDWYGDPCKKNVCGDGRANGFNAAEGLAIQEQYGPFLYPDVTVRVFPLEADWETLRTYCDDNVNGQGDPPFGNELPTIGDSYFEPWGSYVYVCVVVHSNVDGIPFSGGNNIGPTAKNQVIFYLPVKWYRRGATGGTGPAHPKDPTLKLYRLAVLTPFAFGEGRQVISEREVNGLSSTYAELAGGPDVWLNTFRGKDRSILAQLTSMLITALDVGQPAREETVLEVVSVPEIVILELESGAKSFNDFLNTVWRWIGCWLAHGIYWLGRLIAWFFRKAFKPPRFLYYIGTERLNYVSLKRVMSTSRDAGKKVAHPFAYQALVLVRKTVERLFCYGWVDKDKWGLQQFVDRLDQDIRIDIHYHEQLDIANKLGLKHGRDISRPGSAPVREFRPRRPFAIRLQLAESLGANVQTKIQAQPWDRDQLVDPDLEAKWDTAPLSGSELADLVYFAKKDGPQQMIRKYVFWYGKGGKCWSWLKP